MQSRFKTLFIPYLLWNFLILISIFVLKMCSAVKHGSDYSDVYSWLSSVFFHAFYDCNVWGTSAIDWLGNSLRNTGPIDLPLWFLRDLIVVTVLSPVIYLVVKKTKIIGIAVLFLASVSKIWTLLPGFSITAFFYFSLGTYFALNDINIIQFVKKYKTFIVLCTMVLLILFCYAYGTILGSRIEPFYRFFGSLCAFYIVSNLAVKHDLLPNKFLVSCCFFIYAFHCAAIPYIKPISVAQRIIHKLIPGNTIAEDIINYLGAPFLTVIICIVSLMILRKIFPKFSLFLSGNK